MTCIASNVRRLKVDIVNGDDANDGISDATALKTIGCAISRFLPTGNHTIWLRHDDRYIDVLHIPDMPEIIEQIVIPPHAGEGALQILAQEEVIADSLVLASALTPITGKETQQTMTFTTSPLTPAALDHAAFIRLHDRNLAPSSLGACLDDFPIVSNTDGACIVVAADPGYASAFDISAGSVVDVVKSQVVWSLPGNNDATLKFPTAAIMNIAGCPLIVSGFIAKAPVDASASHSSVFLASSGPGLDAYTGPPTMLNRITVRGGENGETWRCVTAGAVTLSALLIEDISAYNLVIESPNYALYNVDVVGMNSFTAVQIGGVAFGFIFGLNVQNASIFIFGGVYLEYVTVDLDASGTTTGTAAFAIFDGVSLQVYALTIINAGNLPALAIGAHHAGYAPAAASFSDGGRVSGVSGNGQHGCTIGPLCSLHVFSGTPTLSGTSGDLKVGANIARAWSAGVETDTVELARFD